MWAVNESSSVRFWCALSFEYPQHRDIHTHALSFTFHRMECTFTALTYSPTTSVFCLMPCVCVLAFRGSKFSFLAFYFILRTLGRTVLFKPKQNRWGLYWTGVFERKIVRKTHRIHRRVYINSLNDCWAKPVWYQSLARLVVLSTQAILIETAHCC